MARGFRCSVDIAVAVRLIIAGRTKIARALDQRIDAIGSATASGTAAGKVCRNLRRGER